MVLCSLAYFTLRVDHPAVNRNVTKSHPHDFTYEDDYMDGAWDLRFALDWANTVWQHDHNAEYVHLHSTCLKATLVAALL
jgi:hypothetical protein